MRIANWMKPHRRCFFHSCQEAGPSSFQYFCFVCVCERERIYRACRQMQKEEELQRGCQRANGPAKRSGRKKPRCIISGPNRGSGMRRGGCRDDSHRYLSLHGKGITSRDGQGYRGDAQNISRIESHLTYYHDPNRARQAAFVPGPRESVGASSRMPPRHSPAAFSSCFTSNSLLGSYPHNQIGAHALARCACARVEI